MLFHGMCQLDDDDSACFAVEPEVSALGELPQIQEDSTTCFISIADGDSIQGQGGRLAAHEGEPATSCVAKVHPDNARLSAAAVARFRDQLDVWH